MPKLKISSDLFLVINNSLLPGVNSKILTCVHSKALKIGYAFELNVPLLKVFVLLYIATYVPVHTLSFFKFA